MAFIVSSYVDPRLHVVDLYLFHCIVKFAYCAYARFRFQVSVYRTCGPLL